MCQLGFVDLDRAKKYCENDEICLGVKLTECNKITENLDCIGTYWRPFKSVVARATRDSVYLLQRSYTGNKDNKDTKVKQNAAFTPLSSFANFSLALQAV